MFWTFFGHSPCWLTSEFSLVSLSLLTLLFLLFFREQGAEISSCDLFASESGQSFTSQLLWGAGQGWMGHKAKQKSWSLSHQSDGLSVSSSKTRFSPGCHTDKFSGPLFTLISKYQPCWSVTKNWCAWGAEQLLKSASVAFAVLFWARWCLDRGSKK